MKKVIKIMMIASMMITIGTACGKKVETTTQEKVEIATEEKVESTLKEEEISEKEKIDKYYIEQVAPLDIYTNLKQAGDTLTSIQKKLLKEWPKDEEEWKVIDQEAKVSLDALKAKKEELDALEIEDEAIQAIHKYLLDSYEQMILANEQYMPAIKIRDMEEVEQCREKAKEADKCLKQWISKVDTRKESIHWIF